MKTAGIVIDPWKIDIFRKHLDAAGYTYEVYASPSLTTLKAEYEIVAHLQLIVQAANDECAAAKRGRMH